MNALSCPLFLALAAAPALAQSASQGLTLSDYLVRQTERIMAADTDGDGRVSRAEISAAAANRTRDVSRMFERMDANGDGYSDKQEIRDALTRRFQRMDRNGDGVVTPDERLGAQMRHRQDRVQPPGGADAADPAAPPRP